MIWGVERRPDISRCPEVEERQLQSRSLTLDHRELLLLFSLSSSIFNLRALFHLEKKVILLQLLQSLNGEMDYGTKEK